MCTVMDSELRLPSGKLLSELRVKDLQKELQKHRLSTTGRKAELLKRLTEFIVSSEDNETGRLGTATEQTAISDEDRQKSDQRKLVKRRSHSRLNETFEYVDNTEDSTQSNVTITPPCGAQSIVNACHRKSSRLSKGNQLQGSADGSVAFESTGNVTPLLPREVHRSYVSNQADTSCHESEDNQDLCYGCVDNSNAQGNFHEIEKRAPEVVNPLSSGDHLSEEQEQISFSRLKTMNSRRPTDGVTSQTFSSASRNVERRINSLNTGGSIPKDSNVMKNLKNEKLKSKIPSRAKSGKDVLERLPLSSHPIKNNGRNATEYFAQKHASIFAGMETIGDLQARVARRHIENLNAVPKAAKRLATPKATRMPLRQRNAVKSSKSEFIFDASNAVTSVTETSFNFGKVEDFPSKNRENVSTIEKPSHLKPYKAKDQRSVKSRTKDTTKRRSRNGFISVTVPVNNPAIDILATPKGMTPTRSRGKVSYTPHRGAIGTFVDTTKLSDREFELAVANGLIKPRSVRKLEKSSLQMEADRRSRRDEILDVKRKLNITS